MGTVPPRPPGGPGFSGRIDEAIESIELELRHAIAYFNDAVVPQIRGESIAALRTMADKMRALADRFDRASSQQATAARPAQSSQTTPPRPEDPRS